MSAPAVVPPPAPSAPAGPGGPQPGAGPAAAPPGGRRLDALRRFAGGREDALFAVALGALLTAITLDAGGGLQLGRTTREELILQALGGIAGILALLQSTSVPRERRWAGIPALAAFAVLAALTLLSIIWAVTPDTAYQEANRTIAYLATFVAGLSLVRLAPQRWSGLLGALIVASIATSAYALLTKVFPGALAPEETYARLREPFGYWNAVGLTAALGVPGCLWLGARRSGHAALNALAYPVAGLLILTMLLAYSRGSLLAAILGCAFWFVFVPLRLRGVAVLATSTLLALPVALWAFGQDGLTTDRAPLDLRTAAGHQLGVALLGLILLLTAAGLAIGFAAARRAPSAQTRQRAGVAILVGLALIPVAGAIGLAFSERGLGGSLSHGWKELTDPNASTPANEPGRLTAVGSVRARYFNDALKIWKARKVVGAGAGGYAVARLRVRTDDLDVQHAHGYLFQTVADFGAIGLLVVIGLLAAWAWAAARATALRPRRGSRPGWRDLPFGPERVGLLSLLAIVVTYGVHSTVDWTWFVPGPTVLALLAAAWVAGRGAEPESYSRWLESTPPEPARLRTRLRAGVRRAPLAGLAAALLAITLVVMWATWQPLRATNTGNDSLELLADGKVAQARDAAERAHRIDPLSIEPLFDLEAVEAQAGRKTEARAALQRAVEIQPRNPDAWLTLAEYDLYVANDPNGALEALGPGLYLDPRSARGVTLFLDASRRVGG